MGERKGKGREKDKKGDTGERVGQREKKAAP